MKASVNKETIRKLSFVYGLLFSAALVVLATSIALTPTAAWNWLPNFMGFIMLVVSAVFALGASLGSKLIAAHVFSRSDIVQKPDTLNEAFVSWFMIRISMTEMACLTASVGYLLTANLLLLGVASLMIVVMWSYKPQPEKANELVARAASG